MFSIVFVVLAVVGSLAVIHCSATCVGSISTSEFDALEVFFISTNGSEWKWNQRQPPSTRWNFPSSLSTPCSSMWQGLTCSYSGTGCVVFALTLPDYNLHGSIPPNIGNLSSIQSLDCSNNGLSGSIPPQLQQMVNLTKLDLSSNDLIGSIPSLPHNLTALLLFSNSLTGSLPTELGQITLLTLLQLYSNCLTGSLPSELGLIISLTGLGLYSNSLKGSLPTELGLMTSLTHLDLYSNNFTGSLPTEMGQMASLSQLDLTSNSLTGSLPTELGQITLLTLLQLYSNCLTGSLPSELGLIISLTGLGLYSNSLTGSLPTELGKLKSLTTVILNNNSLTGTLPTELGQIASMMNLYLYSNCLTGSLPSELGQMTSLTYLWLCSNCLTGSLPSELGQMTSLSELELYSNSLTGSLPTELGQLTSLILLLLYSNSLTGSLPSSLGRMTKLLELALFSNSLTGSLPTELGQILSLSYLNMYSNSLTGLLPSELGQLRSLTLLQVNDNSLIGSLPTELGQMTSMRYLYLNRNCLTGSLPTALGQMTLLIELDLSSNSLTGSLPSELQNCNQLLFLILFSNWLSNQIPIGMIALKELQDLDLHCNYLSSSLPQNVTFLKSFLLSADMSMNMMTGSIPLLWGHLVSYNVSFNLFDGGLDLLFNSSASLYVLVLLDVSHNLLSGPLPSQWSGQSVPSLQTLLMSSNCFSGSISPSFHQLPSLQNLILDAYGSAPGCSVNVPSWLSWLVKGLFPKRSGSTYSLPSEIVQMSTLLTLHAAGNALIGALPDLLTGSSLVEVSLANNNIEGTIPVSWQTHAQFIQLDLSCNKLSGTLSSDLVVPLLSNNSDSLRSGSYDLSVNRLSGNIPSSLYTAQGLNILDGNLFQCQENHIPEYDVNRKVTVCGSDTMNLSLYMWLGTCVCVLCLCLWLGRQGYENWNSLQRHDAADDFLNGIKMFAQVTAASAMFSLLVLLTTYVTLKIAASSEYSTHRYQYGWMTTAAYLHGAFPSILVVMSMVLVSMAIYFFIYRIAVQKIQFSRRWTRCDYLKIGTMLLCHMVITLTSNVLYLLAVLVGLPFYQLTLVQVALGYFKLLWNSVYIGWSIKRLPFLSISDRLQLSSAMKIFTFLASPYVATFFSDSTCFRYVITGSPVVDASFVASTMNCYEDCNYGSCVPLCTMNEVSLIYTSTSPPWLYSYQCSSALLNDYVPVLIISYVMSGLIIPALVTAYSLQSQQFINSWMSPFVYDTFLKNSVYDHCCYNSNPTSVVAPKSHHRKSLFKSYDVVSKLILNLTVLLSFGFAAPLLGVIVAVDSCSAVFMWRLLINRFKVLNTVESSDGLKSLSPHALARLKSATDVSFAGLRSCCLLALVSVAFFWSIFVFDMVGDVYGAEVGGLSVLGVTLSLLCVVVVPALLRRLHMEQFNILSSNSCNVEMNNTSSPLTSSLIVDMSTEMNSEYL